MARPQREISSTGIYHVMLRGINRQIIFEHSVDYRKFIDLLRLMVSPSDEFGRSLPSLCQIYAYCLMPNHVHMIIQEKSANLSIVIHRIATAYALYYNKKYERYGHLFQDRFRSEPVNDETYFITLLRYVHQNPVASGLCKHVADYEWSSWGEYIGEGIDIPRICSVSAVLRWKPIEELRELINEPLPKTIQVIDFDRRKGSVNDCDVVEFLGETYGLRHPSDLQLYTKERRNEILQVTKEFGASIKQLSRLTGIGEKIIRNAKGRNGA